MSPIIFLLIILALYLGFLKVISFYAYKKSSNNTEDYFLSARDVGVIALIGTVAASLFSTGTVVAAPSEFYSKGVGFMWIFVCVFVPIHIMFLGVKFWKLGQVKHFVTPGDLMGDFYKSTTVSRLVGFLGLAGMIPYSAAQLVAVGKTFEVITDSLVSYEIGITIICLAMALYLYYGGSRAVVWTDMIQGVLLTVLLVVTACLVVYWSGGWNEMINNAFDKKPSNFVFTPSVKYFEVYINQVSWFFLPYVWQRMYMSRNAKALAKVALAISMLFFILFLVTWVIGNSTFTLLPNGFQDGDFILGAMFKKYAPYFGAFVIVAVFSAGMSTVDSQLLSSGSLITYDFKKSRSPKKSNNFVLGRNFTLGLLAFIYVWSLFLKTTSVYSLILMSSSMAVILIPAVIGIFYWKRSTTQGAVASIVVGMLIFFTKTFTPLEAVFLETIGTVSWTLMFTLVTYISVCLLTDHAKLDDKRSEYNQILKVPK